MSPERDQTEIPTGEVDFSNVRERTFEIKSSFGPTSHEVASMRDQVETHGRPITAYEFVQGMVDYQRGQPPARIFLVYQDGERREFTGTGNIASSVEGKELSAIEFCNSGPGLTPSDVTDIRHPSTDETRGKWGRGTSVTATYLASKGIVLEVESNAFDEKSNVPNRAWKGRTDLRPNTADGKESMYLDGQWQNRTSSGTVFRVLDPDENLIEQVRSLPEYFLPANPNCDDAVVVEKVSGLKRPPVDVRVANQHRLNPARVRCLKGIVAFENGENGVYVDGLKVTDSRTGYRQGYKYPWALDGCRGLDYPLGVERDFDSKNTTNGNAYELIQFALRHNTDSEIFDELLRDAVIDYDLTDKKIPMELERPRNSERLNMNLSSESAHVLKVVWVKRYGPKAVIAKDLKQAEAYTKKNPEQPVVIVAGSMREWLKQAGVGDAEDLITEETKEFKPNHDIKVGYANDPQALNFLFEELGQCFSGVKPEQVLKVLKHGDKKVVEIELPYSISEESDLYDRAKPGATWARVAAVVGKEHGFEVGVVSQSENRQTNLQYEVADSGSGYYQTVVKAVSDVTDKKLPKIFAQTGHTLITLDGDILQQIEPPPALAESLRKIAVEMAKAGTKGKKEWKEVVGKAKPFKIPDQVGVSRRSLLGKTARVAAGAATLAALPWTLDQISGIPVPDIIKGLLKGKGGEIYKPGFVLHSLDNRIGTADSPLGVFELDYKEGLNVPVTGRESSGTTVKAREVRYESRDNFHPATGYFREAIGNAFVLGADGGGHWVAAENYEQAQVGNVPPKDYSLKITLTGLEGQSRLPVRAGEAVLAVTSQAPVQVIRETASGNYVVRGLSSNQEVVAYIGADPNAPNRTPPIPPEAKSILKLKDLNNDWQLFIGAILAKPNLSNADKTAAVLQKWGENYMYSDFPKLNEQVKGKTSEEVCTRIVNTQAGLCNTSGTGFVGLLREVGVPSRVVVGSSVDISGSARHLWAEFWNGNAWQEVESLHKSKIDPKTKPRAIAYMLGISKSEQSKNSKELVSESKSVLRSLKDLFNGIVNSGGGNISPQKPSEFDTGNLLRDAGLVAAGAVGKTFADRARLAYQNRKRKKDGKEMK